MLAVVETIRDLREFIAAYLLAASRIAGPLANLWASLPKPWAVVIPAIVALLPQVADLFTDVNSWQSFAVSVSSAIALILPGIKPKPPEPPSGGPSGRDIPAGPLTDEEPPSLPGAFKLSAFIAVGWMLAGCAGAPPAPPCDPATLSAITAECSAKAYQCGQQGIPEAECAPMIECDQRLDARAERCRQ